MSRSRRFTVRLVGAAVVVAAMLVLAGLAGGATAVAGAEPTDATSTRYKIVTETFSSPKAIRILDEGSASPYPAKSRVNNRDNLRGGEILDVNLVLKGFRHTYPEDVDVLLVGPEGQNALVMSDAGFDFDVVGVNLTLDDEARKPLSTDTPLVSGRFQPTDYPWEGTDFFPTPAPTPSGDVALSVFDGTNPNGRWKLYVVDRSSQDRGRFADGWALRIQAKIRR
jgi:subtilisin-like proprotein convertase family protein